MYAIFAVTCSIKFHSMNALTACPRMVGVVTRFQDLVKFRTRTLPRKRQRATHAGTWAVLAAVVAEREGQTEVEWVRGHSGDLGNELADEIATGAVEQDTPPWQADLSTQHDITFTASCHGQQLESDLRQFLKQQRPFALIRHGQHRNG